MLLIGSYAGNRQPSMERFSESLSEGLQRAGVDVRLVRPGAVLKRASRAHDGLWKWLGYVDRFILFPVRLRWEVGGVDLVHICDHADAVYIGYIGQRPHLITCHDVLAIRSALGEIEGNPTRPSGRLLQRWILKWIRRAGRVVCVSNATRKELLRVSGLARGKTAVVRNALNYPYHPMGTKRAARLLNRRGIEDTWPFFIHVGGNEWYKNRTGVISIFCELTRDASFSSHRLVLIGRPLTKAMWEIIRAKGIERRVIQLEGITCEELCALYSMADALIFPSLMEGFGWPLIEAQACGCLVFTSNRAPMTDVGSDAAVYFDPDDSVQAAEVIRRHINETENRRARGLENAQMYELGNMIEGYIREYWVAIESGKSGKT